MATTAPIRLGQFELEVPLDVDRERAWELLTRDIDRWWLPDFRVTGEGCVVSLDARAGGHLKEVAPDGTELVWYTVQMVRPGSTLYLVGYSAPDWGGPNVTMLKLHLVEGAAGTVLRVSDALIGQVDDSRLATLQGGWKYLFESGFGEYATNAGAV